MELKIYILFDNSSNSSNYVVVDNSVVCVAENLSSIFCVIILQILIILQLKLLLICRKPRLAPTSHWEHKETGKNNEETGENNQETDAAAQKQRSLRKQKVVKIMTIKRERSKQLLSPLWLILSLCRSELSSPLFLGTELK